MVLQYYSIWRNPTILWGHKTAVVSAEILRHPGGTKLPWSPLFLGAGILVNLSQITFVCVRSEYLQQVSNSHWATQKGTTVD